VLSEKQIKEFERDGYLVVENALSAEELARFGSAVDLGVAHRSQSDNRKIGEKTLYEQSFIQCINLWEDHEEIRPLAFHPRLGEMASELLRTDAVRIWHDQALYKEPDGRITDPHQDLPFWPIRPADQVTAWIPFDGSRKDAGAMAYLPGSHAVGLKRFVDISHTLHPEPYDVLADPKVAAIAPVWVEAPVGSVVFHHSLTVHLAAANESDSTRRVYCIIYFADGCVRDATWPHITVDRQGIEVGEKIQGDVSPIVWPRESGDLPPTPTSRGPQTGFR
jgi:ectoine hydroxylase-related dioxygenase (phytanoyl-CoA dioxygenase family)